MFISNIILGILWLLLNLVSLLFKLFFIWKLKIIVSNWCAPNFDLYTSHLLPIREGIDYYNSRNLHQMIENLFINFTSYCSKVIWNLIILILVTDSKSEYNYIRENALVFSSILQNFNVQLLLYASHCFYSLCRVL